MVLEPPARVLQLEILHARRALQGLQCVSKERGSKEINFSLRIWKKRLCAFSFFLSFSPSADAAGRKMPHWAMVRFKFSAVPLAVHLTRSGAINHSGRMLNVHNDVLTIITFERPNNNTLDSK